MSEAFFGKHWPTRELNGLAQCEVDGRNVILPIWHGIDEKMVRGISPPLADRVALSWTKGLYSVAIELMSTIRPDLANDLKARTDRIVPLASIQSGQQLAAVIAGSHMFQFFNDTTEDRAQSEMVADFVQHAQDLGDLWSDLEAGERVRQVFKISEALTGVLRRGWSVYVGRAKRRVNIASSSMILDVAVVAVVQGSPAAVLIERDRIIVVRPPGDAD